MISFFKNNDNVNDNESFSKIAALLIHTAKIDESYSEDEKIIIKKTLLELGAKDSNIDKIMTAATTIEENSNQILDFTKEIKSAPEKDKIKIIECLWKIIYSNENADVFETNLMRRLTGLLYIDPKIVGHLKEKIKEEIT